MENVLSIKEVGISMPLIPEMVGAEKEIEQKIEKLKKMLSLELQKIITLCKSKSEISEEKIIECQNDFFSKEYFTKAEEINDEKKWAELDKKWWRLNKKFYKLRDKILKKGCDEYDLKYCGQSELYQFFHEDPDKRRDRLEAPIQREIEAVEEETAFIEAEQEKMTAYSIQADSEIIKDSFQKFYRNLLLNE